MFTALALSIASRRRGFPAGSPPPALAATVISLITLVNKRPRWASTFAFLCLMPAHFECPDIRSPSFRAAKIAYGLEHCKEKMACQIEWIRRQEAVPEAAPALCHMGRY